VLKDANALLGNVLEASRGNLSLKMFFLDELALAIEAESIARWYLDARVLPWVTEELLAFVVEHDNLNATEVREKGLKEELWFNVGHLEDRRIAQILPFCCGRSFASPLGSPAAPSPKPSQTQAQNAIIVFPALLRFHIDFCEVVALLFCFLWF
jgi:hypothetical protein